MSKSQKKIIKYSESFKADKTVRIFNNFFLIK
jgi:hypothetical protein